MSKAQRFWLGLLYGAIAVLGAAYGVFEQPQAIDRLANSMKQSLPLMKEMLPFSLLLILALVVYGLFRAAGSVLERLNGASIAAHSSLHTNHGKARKQIV
jgi:hypothetical protein